MPHGCRTINARSSLASHPSFAAVLSVLAQKLPLKVAPTHTLLAFLESALMPCHFQSHMLLMQHGKGPAWFNIQEKLSGQGSLFSFVPHKAVCDQIRHRAIEVRNTAMQHGTRRLTCFFQTCNRPFPCSAALSGKPPKDLTAGYFVFSVPLSLRYLITFQRKAAAQPQVYLPRPCC